MTEKRLSRPRDPIQLGKLIGDILTGQVEDSQPAPPSLPERVRARDIESLARDDGWPPLILLPRLRPEKGRCVLCKERGKKA